MAGVLVLERLADALGGAREIVGGGGLGGPVVLHAVVGLAGDDVDVGVRDGLAGAAVVAGVSADASDKVPM